jgi:hypothetical protein
MSATSAIGTFGSGPTDRRCPFTGQKRKSLLNNPSSVDDPHKRHRPKSERGYDWPFATLSLELNEPSAGARQGPLTGH